MSFLTKPQILYEIEKKNILIETDNAGRPFEKKQVQEASIDLRLSNKYFVFKGKDHTIDTRKIVESDDTDGEVEKLFSEKTMTITNGYLLKPNDMIFSTIYEKITLPDYLVGIIISRSWFARLGISIIMSAPYCPPGIKWNFPLQIKNCSEREIRIYPFTYLGQILFSATHGTPVGYKGLYDNSISPIIRTGGNEIPKTSTEDFKLIKKG